MKARPFMKQGEAEGGKRREKRQLSPHCPPQVITKVHLS